MFKKDERANIRFTKKTQIIDFFSLSRKKTKSHMKHFLYLNATHNKHQQKHCFSHSKDLQSVIWLTNKILLQLLMEHI